MKSLLLTLLLITISSTSLFAEWKAGVDIARAEISGVRGYGTGEHTTHTGSMSVPSIFISKEFSSGFSLQAKYSYYDEIESEGISGSSDIFNTGKIALAVMTPFKIKEDIHELSLNLSYSIRMNDTFSVRLGPTISLSNSKADFFLFNDNATELGLKQIDSKSSTDVTGGAEIHFQIEPNENWSSAIYYRFSNLPDRDVDIIGISIGYSW